MKYIRTKDGRILKVFKDNVSLWEENDGVAYYGDETVDFETSCYLPKSQIIKQDETIEKLCDRVVVKDFNVKEPRVYNLKKCNWKEIADTLFNERKVEWVKFAIWTDKGLVYVADMNQAGDIVLL